MFPCEIKVCLSKKTYRFNCVESAYQALKCPERVKEFINLDGYEAKKLGKTVSLRDDWNVEKVNAMTELLKQKFADPNLLSKLRSVKGEIVEHNFWGDRFWGKCYGLGENMLGKILMKIRDNKDPENK